MALTGTDRGTGTHNTGATTFTLSPASNFAAGSMAVICIAADNAGSGGGAFSTFTVTDGLGNTWTRRISPLYDPGTASSGVEGAIFTTPMNGGVLQTGTVITVTFNASPVAKAWTLMEVAPASGNGVGFVTANVNTGSATAAPTVTTSSITNGNMVIGGLFNEAGTTQTVTADADTTNGTWSARQIAQIGSTTSGMVCASQRKVVTATATQTFNPTMGISGDVILGWIELRETIAYTGDVSESVTLTESVGGAFDATIDVSESTSITEAVGEVYTPSGGGGTAYFGDVSEMVTVTEEIGASFAAVATPSESVTIGESMSIVRGALVATAETLILSEVLAGVLAANAALSESAALTEQLAAGIQLSAAVSESLALSESIESTRSAVVGVAETLDVVDSFGSLATYATSVGESLSLSENTDGQQGGSVAYTGDVAESITIGESISASLAPPPVSAAFPDGRIYMHWVAGPTAAFAEEGHMRDEKPLRQGDTPKTIRVRAFTADVFPDLSTYTGLTFRMVGPVTVEGAAVGLAEGWLEYTFTGDELDIVGTYQAVFHGVAPNGEPQTFPESTNLRVVIEPAI